MEELLKLMRQYIKTDEKLLEELHSFSKPKTYPKKTEIRTTGYTWKELYFIVSGCVRHYYINQQGEERTCDFSLEGHFFTDFQSLNSQEPSMYSYQSLEETSCLQLPYENLLEAYKKYPELERFGRIMAENTANRISLMTHGLLMLSSEERYLNLIKNRPSLLQRVPQKYIASYLGLKAESLSRLKRNMQKN